jgi:hypothetical protein
VFSPVINGREKVGYWLPDNSVFHVPNVYLSKPRTNHYHYIDDKEDAHTLRRSFISDFDIATMKGPDKPIQIGIIQRERNRIITNIADLKRGIQDHFINANVTVTNFDFKTVKEQASWFATKDIIVAVHGACLANPLSSLQKQLYWYFILHSLCFKRSNPWWNKLEALP